MSIGLAGAGYGRTMPSRGLFLGTAAAHRDSALPLLVCADMRFAFALLLRGAPRCLFLLGAPKIATIALRTVVFRGAGFLQGNGYRLPTALDLAATPTLQFAVLEFVHHPAGDPLLPG